MIKSDISAAIPPEFMDPAGRYFVEAYRGRAIFFSERVKPSELSTYEDLANPKWKGRIACLGQPRLQPGAVWTYVSTARPRPSRSSGRLQQPGAYALGAATAISQRDLRRQVRCSPDEHLLLPDDARQPGEAVGRGSGRVLPNQAEKARSSCVPLRA